MIGLRNVLFILLFGLLLAGCNATAKEEKYDRSQEEKPDTEEKSELTEEVDSDSEEKAEKEDTEPVFELDDELTFGEFTINFEQLEIEDDKAILTYRWLNQAGDGDKFFFALAGIDVEQEGSLLEEVSGAYDANNKNTSDMYFPNAENGETKVTLEYELVDTNTPIKITIVPYNEFDESQSITVDIN